MQFAPTESTKNMSTKKLIFETSSLNLLLGDFNLQYFCHTDLDAIVSIENSAHQYPWNLQNFKSSLGPHHCIGLRHNDVWVAYAILSFVVGEAELLLFVLDKPWQGKGIASAFLRELMALSSIRAQSMFLEVRSSNQNAIDLYDAVGFNEVGVRPNYYPFGKGQREDALLLALDF